MSPDNVEIAIGFWLLGLAVAILTVLINIAKNVDRIVDVLDGEKDEMKK